MRIEILGAESLGVRGLCCLVETAGRRIVIDPGVALGYRRQGLLPHPLQVAAGEDVRAAIVCGLQTATDVVISHFHGDHMPLVYANPFQLSLARVIDLLKSTRLWIKRVSGESRRVARRRQQLLAALERAPAPCDNGTYGPLAFSVPMPHGPADRPMGTVMMTRVMEGNDVFVHASDIQLLADAPIEAILRWEPRVVLTSGPALYRNPSAGELARARERVLLLTRYVDVCIIDHHILRSQAGAGWLDDLHRDTGGRVLCAADFMGWPRRLLESARAELYAQFPVPRGWHDRYARGQAGTQPYRL